jgi:hypothetical protein
MNVDEAMSAIHYLDDWASQPDNSRPTAVMLAALQNVYELVRTDACAPSTINEGNFRLLAARCSALVREANIRLTEIVGHYLALKKDDESEARKFLENEIKVARCAFERLNLESVAKL